MTNLKKDKFDYIDYGVSYLEKKNFKNLKKILDLIIKLVTKNFEG